MKRAITLVVLGVATRALAAPPAEPAAVRAMKDELARATELELPGLGKPYYVSYELWDSRYAQATASLGALVSSDAGPHRFIDIDLRVGSYELDNANFGERFSRHGSITLDADDDYDAIRRDLWLATDNAYKSAGETLERKEAILKQETRDPDDAASFSKDTPSTAYAVVALETPDKLRLEQLAKKLSGVFRSNPDAYRASVHVAEVVENRYFVSSEGALAATPMHEVRVTVDAATQADDGMPLRDTVTFTAASFDKLPPEAEMVAQVEALSKELTAFRKAPVVDDYDGPVLFRGVAAGQVIRQLLAEDFSGTPAPKGDRPGARAMGESALIGKVGQRILPVGVSIVDDPTVEKVGTQAMTGHYVFDEEGIAAQRVSLVENGIFKRFLMSRTPRKGFEHSTGHGRSTRFSEVRAHPANLIVSSTKGVADRELVRRALAAAKEQELPYVLVVDRLAPFDPTDIDFSLFASDTPTLAHPALMKRVYPDGHEELVRGASFGGVPLRVLKDLLGIGKTAVPYHYVGSGLGRRFDALYDGSEGGIAISILAPSLLFRDLDIKKPHGPHKKPPIAPRP
jgi:predicted Zn-dependent protease